MRFACGHIANYWPNATLQDGRLDHGVMLFSKPYRKSERDGMVVWRLRMPSPKTLKRAYPPRWYINRSSDAAATRKRSSALLRLRTSV